MNFTCDYVKAIPKEFPIHGVLNFWSMFYFSSTQICYSLFSSYAHHRELTFWIWHVGNPAWVCSENRGLSQQATNTSLHDWFTSWTAFKGTSTEEGAWTSTEERSTDGIQQVWMETRMLLWLWQHQQNHRMEADFMQDLSMLSFVFGWHDCTRTSLNLYLYMSPIFMHLSPIFELICYIYMCFLLLYMLLMCLMIQICVYMLWLISSMDGLVNLLCAFAS